MNPRDAVDTMIDQVGVQKASAACKVAAVLFTYRCTIACRHCCFGCGGNRPAVAMSPERCAEALAQLHETGRVIHIAGGEAMLYWNALAEALTLAASRGAAPHFIETNCSFATSDELVRERLNFMADHGVRGLYASADPYHQEFVPAERFLRVRRLASEIFGAPNFYGPQVDAAAVAGFEAVVRDPAKLREYVRSRPPVMVGTAQARLADYLDKHSPDDSRLPWRGWNAPVVAGNCAAQFRGDTMWELHVDPYGNLQTNCGVILGTISAVSPARLLAGGPENANRFVRTLCQAGPLGLARLARDEYGFALPALVSQNCELCFLTRRFLRTHHPDVFGPAEVYA